MQINDYDEPIEVAQKLIYESVQHEVFGLKLQRNRFSYRDIVEIRDYLTAYINNHEEEDE